MKRVENIVSDIERLISEDESLKDVLRRHLNLIILVNDNYSHIDQMEVLVELLKGGLSSYIKEYRPKEEKMIILLSKLSNKLQWSHYASKEEGEINIRGIYAYLIGKESYVKKYK